MPYAPRVPNLDIDLPAINIDDPQARWLKFAAPLSGKAHDRALCLPARRASLSFTGTGTTRSMGKYGRCLDLNGSGYLTGDNVNYFGGDGITVTGFVSCRVASTDFAFIYTSGIILGANSATSGATSMGVQLYNTGRSGSCASKEFTNSRRGLQDMFFFAARYRLADSKADFCVNGEFEYEVSGVTITPSSQIINIGYFPGFGWSNNGQMKDMRIYSHLLSDQAILDIMSNPNRLYMPTDEEVAAVIGSNKMLNLFE